MSQLNKKGGGWDFSGKESKVLLGLFIGMLMNSLLPGWKLPWSGRRFMAAQSVHTSPAKDESPK